MNEKHPDHRLHEYLDDELSPSEREIFEKELAANAELAERFQAVKKVRTLLAEMPGERVSQEVTRRILAKAISGMAAGNVAQRSDRIAAENDPAVLSGHSASASFPAAKNRFFSWRAIFAVSGVLCLAVVAGVLFLNDHPSGDAKIGQNMETHAPAMMPAVMTADETDKPGFPAGVSEDKPREHRASGAVLPNLSENLPEEELAEISSPDDDENADGFSEGGFSNAEVFAVAEADDVLETEKVSPREKLGETHLPELAADANFVNAPNFMNAQNSSPLPSRYAAPASPPEMQNINRNAFQRGSATQSGNGDFSLFLDENAWTQALPAENAGFRNASGSEMAYELNDTPASGTESVYYQNNQLAQRSQGVQNAQNSFSGWNRQNSVLPPYEPAAGDVRDRDRADFAGRSEPDKSDEKEKVAAAHADTASVLPRLAPPADSTRGVPQYENSPAPESPAFAPASIAGQEKTVPEESAYGDDDDAWSGFSAGFPEDMPFLEAEAGEAAEEAEPVFGGKGPVPGLRKEISADMKRDRAEAAGGMLQRKASVMMEPTKDEMSGKSRSAPAAEISEMPEMPKAEVLAAEFIFLLDEDILEDTTLAEPQKAERVSSVLMAQKPAAKPAVPKTVTITVRPAAEVLPETLLAEISSRQDAAPLTLGELQEILQKWETEEQILLYRMPEMPADTQILVRIPGQR